MKKNIRGKKTLTNGGIVLDEFSEYITNKMVNILKVSNDEWMKVNAISGTGKHNKKKNELIKSQIK